MIKKDNPQTVLEFLENEQFILWQLTGDDVLNAYWSKYINDQPHLKGSFEKAVKQFRNIRIEKRVLGEPVRSALLNRIKESAERMHRRAYIFRIVRYAAVAACTALIVGISYIMFGGWPKISETTIAESIVGKQLTEQSIQVQTLNGISYFDNNISLRVDATGLRVLTNDGKEDIIDQMATEINTLTIPYGKQSNIELSDGTHIWLNSGTVLKFPTIFENDIRKIQVDGEAYLEVAKDIARPFIVQTQNLNIRVYGTQFNVSAYANDKSSAVVLVNGSVGVIAPNGQEVIMQPNQLVSYSDASFHTSYVNPEKYVSWKDHYLIFDNAPISEVLPQLGRYYNLSFNIDEHSSVLQRKCTGKIYLSDDLNLTLRTVCLLASCEFENKNGVITIQ